MPTTDRFLIASAWQLATLAANVVFKYGTIFVMAAFIEPAEWAIAAVSLVILNLANTFSDAGFGPALVQREEITELHQRVAMTGSVVIGALLSVCLYFAAPWMGSFYENSAMIQPIRWMSLAFVIQSFGLVSISLLRRALKFKQITIIETFSLIVTYALPGIALAYMGFGCYSVIVATLAFTTTYALLSFIYAAHNPIPSFNRQAFRDLRRFSVGLTSSRAANFAALNADKLILLKFLPDFLFGLYDMAFRIMMIPVKNAGAFADNLVFSFLCRLKGTQQKQAGFVNAISLTSLLAMPLSVFCVAVCHDLVKVVLPPRWHEVGPVVTILLVSLYFRFLLRVSDASVRALGAVFQGALNKLLYFAMVVVACLVAGALESLSVACWGIVAAAAITAMAMLLLNGKLLGLSVHEVLRHSMTGLPIASVLALSCILVRLASMQFGCSSLVNLVLYSLIGILCLVVFVVGESYFLNERNRALLQEAIGLIQDRRPQLRPILTRIFPDRASSTT